MITIEWTNKDKQGKRYFSYYYNYSDVKKQALNGHLMENLIKNDDIEALNILEKLEKSTEKEKINCVEHFWNRDFYWHDQYKILSISEVPSHYYTPELVGSSPLEYDEDEEEE